MKDIEQLLDQALPEINFLKVTNPKIIPGAILESPEVDQWIGNIRYLLGDDFSDTDFETELVPAGVNLKEAKGSFSGEVAVNVLNALGINLKRQSQFTLNLEISQVKFRHFRSDKLGVIQLERAVKRMKREDEATYRSLRGRFLVFSSYYASQFKLQFDSSAGTGATVNLQADLDGADLELDILSQDNVVLVNNNETIPFGVFGYKITRTGRILEA
ncbi:MAG: hypothetical protein AAF289_18170 [Cyanobacteria bacterium P01_A01_bin.135]